MSVDILLVIFVGVTAIAMVLQAVFVIKTMRIGKNLLDKASEVSQEIETESQLVMSQLREVGASFEEMRRVFDSAGERVEGITNLIDARFGEIDQLASQVLDVGNRQVSKVSDVVDDTLQKFRETTGIIQEDIVRPVVEISSLIKGIRTGLDYLVASRRSRRKNSQYPEDELFI